MDKIQFDTMLAHWAIDNGMNLAIERDAGGGILKLLIERPRAVTVTQEPPKNPEGGLSAKFKLAVREYMKFFFYVDFVSPWGVNGSMSMRAFLHNWRVFRSSQKEGTWKNFIEEIEDPFSSITKVSAREILDELALMKLALSSGHRTPFFPEVYQTKELFELALCGLGQWYSLEDSEDGEIFQEHMGLYLAKEDSTHPPVANLFRWRRFSEENLKSLYEEITSGED